MNLDPFLSNVGLNFTSVILEQGKPYSREYNNTNTLSLTKDFDVLFYPAYKHSSSHNSSPMKYELSGGNTKFKRNTLPGTTLQVLNANLPAAASTERSVVGERTFSWLKFGGGDAVFDIRSHSGWYLLRRKERSAGFQGSRIIVDAVVVSGINVSVGQNVMRNEVYFKLLDENSDLNVSVPAIFNDSYIGLLSSKYTYVWNSVFTDPSKSNKYTDVETLSNTLDVTYFEDEVQELPNKNVSFNFLVIYKNIGDDDPLNVLPVSMHVISNPDNVINSTPLNMENKSLEIFLSEEEKKSKKDTVTVVNADGSTEETPFNSFKWELFTSSKPVYLNPFDKNLSGTPEEKFAIASYLRDLKLNRTIDGKELKVGLNQTFAVMGYYSQPNSPFNVLNFPASIKNVTIVFVNNKEHISVEKDAPNLPLVLEPKYDIDALDDTYTYWWTIQKDSFKFSEYGNVIKQLWVPDERFDSSLEFAPNSKSLSINSVDNVFVFNVAKGGVVVYRIYFHVLIEDYMVDPFALSSNEKVENDLIRNFEYYNTYHLEESWVRGTYPMSLKTFSALQEKKRHHQLFSTSYFKEGTKTTVHKYNYASAMDHLVKAQYLMFEKGYDINEYFRVIEGEEALGLRMLFGFSGYDSDIEPPYISMTILKGVDEMKGVYIVFNPVLGDWFAYPNLSTNIAIFMALIEGRAITNQAVSDKIQTFPMEALFRYYTEFISQFSIYVGNKYNKSLYYFGRPLSDYKPLIDKVYGKGYYDRTMGNTVMSGRKKHAKDMYEALNVQNQIPSVLNINNNYLFYESQENLEKEFDAIYATLGLDQIVDDGDQATVGSVFVGAKLLKDLQSVSDRRTFIRENKVPDQILSSVDFNKAVNRLEYHLRFSNYNFDSKINLIMGAPDTRISQYGNKKFLEKLNSVDRGVYKDALKERQAQFVFITNYIRRLLKWNKANNAPIVVDSVSITRFLNSLSLTLNSSEYLYIAIRNAFLILFDVLQFNIKNNNNDLGIVVFRDKTRKRFRDRVSVESQYIQEDVYLFIFKLSEWFFLPSDKNTLKCLLEYKTTGNREVFLECQIPTEDGYKKLSEYQLLFDKEFVLNVLYTTGRFTAFQKKLLWNRYLDSLFGAGFKSYFKAKYVSHGKRYDVTNITTYTSKSDYTMSFQSSIKQEPGIGAEFIYKSDEDYVKSVRDPIIDKSLTDVAIMHDIIQRQDDTLVGITRPGKREENVNGNRPIEVTEANNREYVKDRDQVTKAFADWNKSLISDAYTTNVLSKASSEFINKNPLKDSFLISQYATAGFLNSIFEIEDPKEQRKMQESYSKFISERQMKLSWMLEKTMQLVRKKIEFEKKWAVKYENRLALFNPGLKKFFDEDLLFVLHTSVYSYLALRNAFFLLFRIAGFSVDTLEVIDKINKPDLSNVVDFIEKIISYLIYGYVIVNDDNAIIATLDYKIHKSFETFVRDLYSKVDKLEAEKYLIYALDKKFIMTYLFGMPEVEDNEELRNKIWNGYLNSIFGATYEEYFNLKVYQESSFFGGSKFTYSAILSNFGELTDNVYRFVD